MTIIIIAGLVFAVAILCILVGIAIIRWVRIKNSHRDGKGWFLNNKKLMIGILANMAIMSFLFWLMLRNVILSILLGVITGFVIGVMMVPDYYEYRD